MNLVTIKEVKGVVQCADDGTAEHVFNVKNATDKPLRVDMQLSIDEPTRVEWLQLEGATEHELDVETMTQVSVKIHVPSDCAPGKYIYRLRVYDPNDPGDNYTDGDPVYFEVGEKKEVITEKKEIDKKPFKWRILVAIAAGVVLVAGILFLILSSGPEVSTFDKSLFGKATFK
jgi:hypothetical protein